MIIFYYVHIILLERQKDRETNDFTRDLERHMMSLGKQKDRETNDVTRETER